MCEDLWQPYALLHLASANPHAFITNPNSFSSILNCLTEQTDNWSKTYLMYKKFGTIKTQHILAETINIIQF